LHKIDKPLCTKTIWDDGEALPEGNLADSTKKKLRSDYCVHYQLIYQITHIPDYFTPCYGCLLLSVHSATQSWPPIRNV